MTPKPSRRTSGEGSGAPARPGPGPREERGRAGRATQPLARRGRRATCARSEAERIRAPSCRREPRQPLSGPQGRDLREREPSPRRPWTIMLVKGATPRRSAPRTASLEPEQKATAPASTGLGQRHHGHAPNAGIRAFAAPGESSRSFSNASNRALLVTSPQQIRNVDLHRVRRAIDLAGHAVPALVVFHVGLLSVLVGSRGCRAGRRRRKRGSPFGDASSVVDDNRRALALVDDRHGSGHLGVRLSRVPLPCSRQVGASISNAKSRLTSLSAAAGVRMRSWW